MEHSLKPEIFDINACHHIRILENLFASLTIGMLETGDPLAGTERPVPPKFDER